MITVLAQNKALIECKAIMPYNPKGKFRIEGYIGVANNIDDSWDGGLILGEYTTKEQRDGILDMMYNHLSCGIEVHPQKGQYGEDLGTVTYQRIFKMPDDLPNVLPEST